MKRVSLVIVMIITLLTACQSADSAAPVTASGAGGTSSKASEASETTSGADGTSREASCKAGTAEERMLNDLVNYIYRVETIYRDLQWVLDSFEKFDEHRTWENLQLARASLSIARHYLDEYSLPELEMTREDEKELMKRGIDTSFMETLEDDFQNEKTLMSNTYLALHYYIMDSVFLQDHWDTSMRNVAVQKKWVASEIQDLAYTADYFLANLNDDTLTGKFYSLMDSYCPLTRSCQADVLESPEKIEKARLSLFKQMEEIELEKSEVIGARKNRSNKLKDLLEKEDYAAIGANLMEISDMPLTVIYPMWYDDEENSYYWKENGEVVKTPAPGTTLERIPDGCMITMSGVTKEEVLEYQTDLEKFGVSSAGSTEEDGKLTILYKYDDSTFAMVWEEDNVTILMTENPVCFVPAWYPLAQNSID